MPDPAPRISIRLGCTSQIVSLSDILYCRADRNFTRFHLVSGAKCISSESLSRIQEKLEPLGFVPIHKSCLVNCLHIRSFSMNGKSCITLSNNEMVSISRRRKARRLGVVSSRHGGITASQIKCSF